MAVVRIDVEVDATTGVSRIKQVGQGIKEAGQEAAKAKGFFDNMLSGIGIGAGMAVFDKMLSGAKGLATFLPGLIRAQDDYVSSILKTESALGLSARAQTVLQRAGADAMVSWEAQTKAITTMARVLDATPEKLHRIGMTFADLKGLAPEQQFEAIGKKVAEIEDPMKRLAVAQEFFGKGAAEVLPLFSGAIDSAREAVDKFGLAIDENGARSIDDLNNTLDIGAEVWAAFERNIVATIASSEPLQTLIEGLVEILGAMSGEVQGNQSALKNLVDQGVAGAAKAFVMFFDVLQFGMDVYDLTIIGVRELSVLLMGLAVAVSEAAWALAAGTPGGKEFAAMLAENITMLKAEMQAQRLAGAEQVDASTKRANALAGLRSKFEDLEKKISSTIGQTHQATVAEKGHAVALDDVAKAATKAGEAFVSYKRQLDNLSMADKWAAENHKALLKELERAPNPILSQPRGFDGKPRNFLSGEHWAETTSQTETAAKATFKWSDALTQVSQLFQTLGIGATSSLARITTQLIGAFAAAERVRGIMTDKAGNKISWSNLDSNGKAGVLGAGLQTAVGAYAGGSVLGGAASGAAFGASFGPWGAAIGAAAGGLLGLFGGRSKKRQQEAAQRQQTEQSAISGLDALVKRLEEFKAKALDAGVNGVNSLMGYLAEKTDLSAERMARMGSIGFGVFEMLRKSGMSVVQAMNALGPAFDAALKKGADGFGEQFAQLAAFRQLVLDNSSLVEAAESIGQIINAYRANGMLTQQLFDDMINENSNLIQDMLDKGFTLDQALAVNKNSLYAIYKAQKDLGLVVDENTQKYIDQAEASGLFEGMKDPMEELVEIQKIQLQIMAELAKAFGAVLPESVQKYLDKLNEIPTRKDTQVNTHYTHDGDPGGGGGTYQPGGGDGLPQYARGGISTSPHVAQLHGTSSNPEVVAPVSALINGIGSAIADRQAGVSVGNLTIVVDGGSDAAAARAAGQEAARAFIDMINSNTGGAKTFLLDTVGTR